MLRITGLDGLGEGTVESENVNIDYPDTLALYIIGTSTGVKKSRESHNFRVTKEWREWEVRLTNVKTRRTERLVSIHDNDFLEEVFESQVTMSMLQPLKYHRLCLVRLKKPGRKDWRAPNKSGLKYGIRVPRNAKEAARFDQENGNKLWANAILKGLEALISMQLFRKLILSLRKSRAKGLQFARPPNDF